MPLSTGKSESAFKQNVRTLMGEIGKSLHVQSRAQALAIAYSKKRGHGPGGRVDAKHDIVSGANSNDRTTYIDRNIPHFSSKLKDKSGAKANLWKYLTIHENDERLRMKEGKSYDDAHKSATTAERKAVEADGIRWHDYSNEMAPYLTCAARKRPRGVAPKNLHVDPNRAIGRQEGGPVDDDEAAPTITDVSGAQPKAGQSVRPQNIAGNIAEGRSKAMETFGDFLGVNDAMKALRGEMTDEEQERFVTLAAAGMIAPEAGEVVRLALPLIRSPAARAMLSRLLESAGTKAANKITGTARDYAMESVAPQESESMVKHKYGGRAEGGHAPLPMDVLGEQMQHHGVPLGGYAPKSGFSNPELAAAIRKLAAMPREQAMARELESGFAPNELRGMYEPQAAAMLNEPGRSFTGAPPQGVFTYGDLEGMGGDARGGRTAQAGGGFAGGTPWYVRQEARGSLGHGMIGGGGFGRTDNLPINVPSGAYVVPADVVSGLGQGNSKAGAGVLHNMFSSGPLGMPAPKIHGGFGGPKNVRMGMMKMPRGSSAGSITTKQSFGVAAGGVAPSHTPIVAASGEFIIHPAVVRRIGGGDLKKGHDTLDALIKIIRKEHIKTLKKLPGPVKRASGGRVPVPKTAVMEDLRDYLDTLNKLRDVA